MLLLQTPDGRMTNEPDPTDQQLARAVLSGDARAADHLIARLRFVPRVLAVFNHRVGGWMDGEDLRDLAQDVVVMLWKRLGSYNGQAALETWAYRFCYHAFMNALRKRQRRGETLAVEEQGSEPAPHPIEYEHLYRGLQALSEREASVIHLKHFDELTFEELGERLDLSPNTAKTLYYRGMRRLAEHLRRQAGEVGP